MDTVHRIDALRAQVNAWRRSGERVALVPTMGNLHHGHIRLVDHAHTLAERIVASVFVNPLQFGPSEDYGRYPRTLEDDGSKLRHAGLDLLFAPELSEVYPRGIENATRVEVPGLSQILCGAFRPGHFEGVATVVTKLFNMVQPDVAVFGEKDWQQLVVIRSLVADLNLPIEIAGVPTVREADGLAMSSRNNYLTPDERRTAPVLFATISTAVERLRAGDKDFAAIETGAAATLEGAGFRPDYVEVRRSYDLARPGDCDHELLVVAAAWLGRARLIDNCRVALPAS